MRAYGICPWLRHDLTNAERLREKDEKDSKQSNAKRAEKTKRIYDTTALLIDEEPRHGD